LFPDLLGVVPFIPMKNISAPRSARFYKISQLLAKIQPNVEITNMLLVAIELGVTDTDVKSSWFLNIESLSPETE
jgi:hypothetical protein